MSTSKQRIVEILIAKANELFSQPHEKAEFTGNAEADDLLNNLKEFPHAFVLVA